MRHGKDEPGVMVAAGGANGSGGTMGELEARDLIAVESCMQRSPCWNV